jgi:hypothetical protein
MHLMTWRALSISPYRMERNCAPPTVTSMSGAWFGCRLRRHGDIGGQSSASASAASSGQSLSRVMSEVEAVFRMTLTVGPGRCCSPRHVMPCNSRNEGLKCG